jgi:hypothetical protein
MPGKGGRGVAVGGTGVAVGRAGATVAAMVAATVAVGAGVAVGSGDGVGESGGVSTGARATLIVTGWTSCGKSTVPIALAGASAKNIKAVKIIITIAPIPAGPNLCSRSACLGFLFTVYLWLNNFHNKV